MPEYLLLMHKDTLSEELVSAWEAYIQKLIRLEIFLGGSEIGGGQSFRKEPPVGDVASHINGFIRIIANDIDSARALLNGNPCFEAGGTVEIRELLITS